MFGIDRGGGMAGAFQAGQMFKTQVVLNQIIDVASCNGAILFFFLELVIFRIKYQTNYFLC